MFRLPFSGLGVSLREPAGAEDLLLMEAAECDTHLALALVERVAKATDGNPINWDSLVLTDFDALLLMLRQQVFGDQIRTDFICPTKDCGVRVEVKFRIRDYLAHHQPRAVQEIEKADDDGWFRLSDSPVSFRLPSAADQLAVAGHAQPERELIRRCVRPSEVSEDSAKRVESLMEELAPLLTDYVQGECPECGSEIDIYFDPQQFSLRELRGQAAYIYEDVHLLARHYHWSEAEILALPRRRRIHYAELIRQEKSP